MVTFIFETPQFPGEEMLAQKIIHLKLETRESRVDQN